MKKIKLLVTGGAGFIGSAVVRHIILNTPHSVVNVDKLTYAGNLSNVSNVSNSDRYYFEKTDVCDVAEMTAVFMKHQPDVVMHLAAESHVDRSIESSDEFIQTNIVGTYNLLEVSRRYWLTLNKKNRTKFRFHHVSTDEVYGDLEETNALFTEETSYSPSSPYSASKAAADHLVRAWGRTYDLPIVITNCSNNYGPYHFPEKLIPLTILNALAGRNLPVYGDGSQVRDWLYVDDHARALFLVATKSKVGKTYNIGGHNELTNIDVVKNICSILEELVPIKPRSIQSYSDLITFVSDRPGHDKRYAIDANKISLDLGWVPVENFESGLRKTIVWFLENKLWVDEIISDYKLVGIGKNQS